MAYPAEYTDSDSSDRDSWGFDDIPSEGELTPEEEYFVWKRPNTYELVPKFRELIRDYPEGLKLKDFQAAYLKKFREYLDWTNYGYKSLGALIMDYSDVIKCIREGTGPDGWLTIDATRPPTEEEKTTLSMRLNPELVMEIKNNIAAAVAHYYKKSESARQLGLPVEKLQGVYEELYGGLVRYEVLGFDSLKSLCIAVDGNGYNVCRIDSRYLLMPPAKPWYWADAPVIEPVLGEPEPERVDIPKDMAGPDATLYHLDYARFIKPGEIRPVIIDQFENPLKFYFRLKEFDDMFQKFKQGLVEFYSRDNTHRMPNQLMRSGQVCAVSYYNSPRLPCAWERGRIIELLNGGRVNIYLVDYGTTTIVYANRVKFLHKQFLPFPVQSIPGTLAGVIPRKPTFDQWTLCTFEQYMRESFLEAQAYCPDFDRPIIPLVIFSRYAKMSINGVLVESYHNRLSPTVPYGILERKICEKEPPRADNCPHPSRIWCLERGPLPGEAKSHFVDDDYWQAEGDAYDLEAILAERNEGACFFFDAGINPRTRERNTSRAPLQPNPLAGAGPSRLPIAGSSRASTAGPSRPSTAGPSRPYTAGPSRPYTAGPSRPYTAGSSRASTAGPSFRSPTGPDPLIDEAGPSSGPPTRPDPLPPVKIPQSPEPQSNANTVKDKHIWKENWSGEEEKIEKSGSNIRNVAAYAEILKPRVELDYRLQELMEKWDSKPKKKKNQKMSKGKASGSKKTSSTTPAAQGKNENSTPNKNSLVQSQVSVCLPSTSKAALEAENASSTVKIRGAFTTNQNLNSKTEETRKLEESQVEDENATKNCHDETCDNLKEAKSDTDDSESYTGIEGSTSETSDTSDASGASNVPYESNHSDISADEDNDGAGAQQPIPPDGKSSQSDVEIDINKLTMTFLSWNPIIQEVGQEDPIMALRISTEWARYALYTKYGEILDAKHFNPFAMSSDDVKREPIKRKLSSMLPNKIYEKYMNPNSASTSESSDEPSSKGDSSNGACQLPASRDDIPVKVVRTRQDAKKDDKMDNSNEAEIAQAMPQEEEDDEDYSIDLQKFQPREAIIEMEKLNTTKKRRYKVTIDGRSYFCTKDEIKVILNFPNSETGQNLKKYGMSVFRWLIVNQREQRILEEFERLFVRYVLLMKRYKELQKQIAEEAKAENGTDQSVYEG